MSSFTGPGSYEIVPSFAETYHFNLWGGGLSVPGTPIKLHPRTTSNNTVWQFVATGLAPDEFYIFSDSAGLPINNTVGVNITVEQVDLRRPYSRWVLAAAENGTYNLNNADKATQLVVKDGTAFRGSPIIQSSIGSSNASRFYIRQAPWGSSAASQRLDEGFAADSPQMPLKLELI